MANLPICETLEAANAKRAANFRHIYIFRQYSLSIKLTPRILLSMEEKQIKTGVFAENRRATFDYEILETFEAGLSLLGSEVKSIQNGKVTITGAQVLFRGGIAYLIGADIQAYQPLNMEDGYDPLRVRPILLKKQEIERLFRVINEQKLTLIALKLYNKGSRIKVLIGLARKRKKSDKREVLKKKADIREIRRER